MASILLIENKASTLISSMAALSDTLSSTKSEYLLLADPTNVLTDSQLDNLRAAASLLEESDIAYISSNGDLSRDELANLDADSLLNSIINKSALSIAAIACKKSTLQNIIIAENESLAEISLRLFAKAISASGKITAIDHSDTTAEEKELSNGAFARSLSFLVEHFTIEDMFPKHAWKEHSEESAAAAYHTLTAYFMRFEDYDSAGECLKLSEKFEESPRSLALRALIAFNKGETLGAVANLVSSLQQYEERKKSTTHYVKFSPQDIELINDSLVSGLDALNKRDNQRALDFFAKAVFNFDAFYAQHGLEDIMQ